MWVRPGAYPIGAPEYLLKIVVKNYITLRPGAFTKKIIEKFKKKNVKLERLSLSVDSTLVSYLQTKLEPTSVEPHTGVHSKCVGS